MSNFNKRITRRTKYRRRGKPALSRKEASAVKAIISNQLKEKVELKYVDETFNATSISFTPTFYDLTEISNGTGKDRRIGSDITLTSIQFQLSFTKADTTNFIRMVLFQWYPNNDDSPPDWTKLFQYHTVGVPVDQQELMSPLAITEADVGTYKIMMNKQFLLDTEESVQLMNGFIKKGFRKNISYAGSLPTVGTNHIYLLLVSDSGATSHPTISGHFRLRYTDM